MIEAQPRARRRIYRGNNTDEYIILFAAKFSQALFIVIDQLDCPRASVVTSFYSPRAPLPLSRLSSERPPIEIAALAVFQDRPGICQFVPFDHRPPPTDLRLPLPFLPAVFLSFVSGLRYHSIRLRPPLLLLLTFDSSSPQVSSSFFLSSLPASISLQLSSIGPHFFIFLFLSSFFLFAFLSLPLLLVANLTLRFLIYRYLFLVPCQPYPAAEILLSIARQKKITPILKSPFHLVLIWAFVHSKATPREPDIFQ